MSKQISYDGSASLYVIPTPIGNMEDITIRALNTLKFVDVILCEDTRESSILLNKYNIKKKLISCHEFNEFKIKEKIINLLKDGKNIGLISDQGTPIISDPGSIITKDIIDAGFNVISLPGATAFVPSLTSSGLNSSRFLFYGFLNSKSTKAKEELNSLKKFKNTIVFYESVHRINKMLDLLLETFGDRNIVLCRELSKKFEEIHRGKISDIQKSLNVIKGEFVVVVEGNMEIEGYNKISILEHINIYMEDGINSKEAIKIVAKERSLPKSVVYSEYHKDK